MASSAVETVSGNGRPRRGRTAARDRSPPFLSASRPSSGERAAIATAAASVERSDPQRGSLRSPLRNTTSSLRTTTSKPPAAARGQTARSASTRSRLHTPARTRNAASGRTRGAARRVGPVTIGRGPRRALAILDGLTTGRSSPRVAGLRSGVAEFVPFLDYVGRRSLRSGSPSRSRVPPHGPPIVWAQAPRSRRPVFQEIRGYQ